jgi:hypothetical protein
MKRSLKKYDNGGKIKKPIFPGKLDNRIVSDNTSVQRPTIQQQDVRLKTPQEVKKANRENFQKRIGVKPTYNVQELTDFGTPEPGLEDASLEALDALSLASGVGYLGKKGLQLGAKELANVLKPKLYSRLTFPKPVVSKYIPSLPNASSIDYNEVIRRNKNLKELWENPESNKLMAWDGTPLKLNHISENPDLINTLDNNKLKYQGLYFNPKKEWAFGKELGYSTQPWHKYTVEDAFSKKPYIADYHGQLQNLKPGANRIGDKLRKHISEGKDVKSFVDRERQFGISKIKNQTQSPEFKAYMSKLKKENPESFKNEVDLIRRNRDFKDLDFIENIYNKGYDSYVSYGGPKIDPLKRGLEDAYEIVLFNKPANLKKEFKKGGIIKDDRGQWAHPGEITEIGSNNITMQGVNYPVLGVSNQGDTQMMYPEQDYQFRGNKVTEYPMMQRGGKVKPIVVNDPNDPRLQAYNDSLSLYNKGKSYLNQPYSNNLYDYTQNLLKFGYSKKIAPGESKKGISDLMIPQYKKPVQPYVYNPITKQTTTAEQIKPLYQAPQLTMPERLELSMNKPNVVQSAEGPTFKQGRKFMRETGLRPGYYEEGGTLQENTNMEYGKGGYTVKRSSDRKGKTHVVIGPDGTKKYFGDPNLGERGKSKYGKEAFYARHKKNLDANPYFRAYARATWEDGGTIPEQGHISMNKRSLFKYGGLTVTDLNKYDDGGINLGNASKIKPYDFSKLASGLGGGSTNAATTGATVSPAAVGAGIGFGAEMVGALIPEKSYTDSEGNDLGSRKSVGESALSSAASGASMGMVAGPWGAAAGAVLGGAYGAIKGFSEKEKMDKLQDEAETRITNKNINKRANASYNWGTPNINTSQNFMFARGGMVLDYDDPNANAELELQETFQMPDGTVGNVDGPSHENGGIAVDLPEGTRIWSDKLKYNGKTFAKHTKPITNTIAKLEKQIEKNPVNSDAKENSIALLKNQLDYYFDTQETNKQNTEMKRTLREGGMIKRADGSYSKRGLWDNIRANKGSGKKPTPEMLKQERKINNEMEMGGYMYGQGGTNNPGFNALPEEVQENILAHMSMGGRLMNDPMFAEGGIHIKPENRGKFTAYAESHGKGVQEMAAHIMANKEDYSPAVVKRANFAKNAAGWKHEMGGLVKYEVGGPFEQDEEYLTGYGTPNVPTPYIPMEYNENSFPMGETPRSLRSVNPYTQNTTPAVNTNPYRTFYETNSNIPKGQPLGSTVNAGMPPVTTPEATGFFNKAGQFIQNNPGLIGQLGTAALTAGSQMNRINRLARPKTLADVRLRDSVANPNLVDYSAERNAIDRAALTGMGEAQRGFGSSAAAQAFKNKARLNQLEGTGRSFQGQENANAQIKNQFLAAQQEAAMKEAMMNSEIGKYNLENVYGYDTMTTAQKNAITAMLGNTAGQTFGKQTDYANQLEKANILSNQYDPSVLNDMIKNGKLKVVDGKIVKARNGGTIKKRSFKK